jgi:hypothetical protein
MTIPESAMWRRRKSGTSMNWLADPMFPEPARANRHTHLVRARLHRIHLDQVYADADRGFRRLGEDLREDEPCGRRPSTHGDACLAHSE